MVIPRKIDSIRKYLLAGNVSFVNNIIVTLPENTQLLDPKGATIDVSLIKKTEPGVVLLPDEANCIGLIDGQHRVFAYYEGGAHEEKMATLRAQQNLLVTGIMYPSTLSEAERTRVAARLFLEINSNQTNVKTDLIQEINLILKPYDAESIAKKTLNELNTKGPLEDVFERFFFDKHKLKTTTVVSYGLKSVVRASDDGLLFQKWPEQHKDGVKSGSDDDGLVRFISFCVGQINLFLAAARSNIKKERWSSDPAQKDRVLNTTSVIGLIKLFQRVVAHSGLCSFDEYRQKLSKIDGFSFSSYKSSQYNKMAEDIYKEYWGK